MGGRADRGGTCKKGGEKMSKVIKITKDGYKTKDFSYFEQVVEWLANEHECSSIDIARELSPQITDVNGCDFSIEGVKYHYEQTEK